MYVCVCKLNVFHTTSMANKEGGKTREVTTVKKARKEANELLLSLILWLLHLPLPPPLHLLWIVFYLKSNSVFWNVVDTAHPAVFWSWLIAMTAIPWRKTLSQTVPLKTLSTLSPSHGNLRGLVGGVPWPGRG